MNYLAGDAFSLLPREGNSPSGLPEEWGVKPDMPHVCSIRLAGSTPVRDKNINKKVGNLANILYLYR